MSKPLEDFLRTQLSTNIMRPLSHAAGGCISNACSYETDNGAIFVKHNTKRQAQVMFEGEAASLEAIMKTNTLKVPKPIKVLEYPAEGWLFVIEHRDISNLKTQQAALGHQLARLHLHNASNKMSDANIGQDDKVYVDKFGFKCDTCCGLLPMPNDWMDDWVEFYCQMRLGKQMELVEQNYKDSEAIELWHRLQRCIPAMFHDITIQPSLLHGDLWSGNVGETNNQPIAYDPASFYGHHEFDLAITKMFGGFSSQFYTAYHSLIPQSPGFTTRSNLYLLFHYLNHWNHFGHGYRSQTIAIMKQLLRQ